MSTILMRSRVGEIKTKQEWETEVNDFWDFVERQNRYICNPRCKVNKRQFKKPSDAFERFARIIGLKEISAATEVNNNNNNVSWEGVF